MFDQVPFLFGHLPLSPLCFAMVDWPGSASALAATILSPDMIGQELSVRRQPDGPEPVCHIGH